MTKRQPLSVQQYWGFAIGLTLLILTLFCPVSMAQSMSDLPNPRQQNGSWILDRAELLSPQIEHQLNQRIDRLAARTSAELAIATLPQLTTPQTPHAFALALFTPSGHKKPPTPDWDFPVGRHSIRERNAPENLLV